MKPKTIFLITTAVATCLCCSFQIQAQNIFPASGAAGIGTTTPNASSLLEVRSTTKGVLFPRMTAAQRGAIASPTTGLLVYQTDGTTGFYYYSGGWKALTPLSANTALSNLGATSINQSLVPSANGTIDIGSTTKRWRNLFLTGNVTCTRLNTASIGVGTTAPHASSIFEISSTTKGALLPRMTAAQRNAIASPATGLLVYQTDNISGFYYYNGRWISLVSPYLDTTNTATGYQAFYSSIPASPYNGDVITYQIWNTATGAKALYSNTGGFSNTATGYKSLYFNTTGFQNTATGYVALYNNTTGYNNTANGIGALELNTTGEYNTANGAFALWRNTTGINNIAIGGFSLSANKTGYENSALGMYANVAAENLSNATALGYGAVVNNSNKVRIGNGNVTVVESAAGSWTVSDERFKTNVKEEVRGLEFIKLLRPVVYNFDVDKYEQFASQNFPDSIKAKRNARMNKSTSKASDVRQTGLIAQEVEIAAKKSGYNFNGVHAPENSTDNYSISYEKLVVPLIKAAQELSAENESLKTDIIKLNERLKNIEALLNVSVKPFNTLNSTSLSSAKLEQNIPNPSEQTTLIKYFLPERVSAAVIKINNINGQTIQVHNIITTGNGQLTLQTSKLTPGVYTYSLICDGKLVDTKSMIIAN